MYVQDNRGRRHERGGDQLPFDRSSLLSTTLVSRILVGKHVV